MRRPEGAGRAATAIAAARAILPACAAAAACVFLAGCAGKRPGGGPGLLIVSNRGGAVRIYEVDRVDGSARLAGSDRADDVSYEDLMPARLPDGRIVFVSDRDGNREIYAVAPPAAITGPGAAGGPAAPAVRLTRDPDDPAMAAADSAPSPLGRDRIVFARTAPGAAAGSARDLYVMGIDGSGPRPITRHAADDGDPSGSPDGRAVVFVSDRDGPSRLYLLPDVDAPDPEAAVVDLSRSAPPRPGSLESLRPFADGAPFFLADGSILFSRKPEGGVPQVYLLGAAGTRLGVRQVTDSLTLPHGAGEPVPDGNGDVLVTTGPVRPPKGKAGPPRYAVYRLALGGFNLSPVTRDRAPYDDFTRRLRPPQR